MAHQIATADGNLTTAATWGVVDATSLLDDNATNTTQLTTAYVESQTFTPGAITIDGIAVHITARAASPTGTMSVRLAQAGATVAGTEVTINVSDISSRDGEQGWYFFKFSSSVLLVAATLYTVSAKTSSSSQVTLRRNATAGNWQRMLRTTTTGAPGAGDTMFVLGEWTAAATKTDRTVTMNETATTDYGAASTTAHRAALGISQGGTLTWAVTAATAFRLRLSGNLIVWHGGSLNMGTAVSQCPRDSSMLLEFDCGADGDFGLQGYGSCVGQGLSRTSGKNIVRCLLNTDEAAAQTTLGVDTDTGWKGADEIAIASTTRTVGDAEIRVLNADAGASSVVVTVGLTNAHSGTSPTQAEVVLISRNVRIESVSATFMAYVHFGAGATVDYDWTLFRYLGTTTSNKEGVSLLTATASGGSANFDYCCIANFDNHGIYIGSGASAWDNIHIRNLTGWKVGNQASNHAAIYFGGTTVTTGNWTLNDICIVSGNTSGGMCIRLEDVLGTVASLRLSSGGGTGLSVLVSAGTKAKSVWDTIHCHSNSSTGLLLDVIGTVKLTNVKVWRNNTTGFFLTSVDGLATIDTAQIFGNATANIGMTRGSARFLNTTIAGDTTFSVPSGFRNTTANVQMNLWFENCTFGVTSGIFVAHTTASLQWFTSSTVNGVNIQVVFNNTVLADATEESNAGALAVAAKRMYQRTDGTTNIHKIVYTFGTVTRETTTIHDSKIGVKMEPTSATLVQKLESGYRQKNVASGATVQWSVWVRKNAGYTGNPPRLMLKANPALGIDQDVVLDTFSAAADTWENLTGTSAAVEENGVQQAYVDCDGTAGEVYVGDWSAV
jgi:hypothetical protein